MNPFNDPITIRVPHRMGKVAEGMHSAKLVDIDTGSGIYGKYIQFAFEVTGTTGERVDISFYTSEKISPATEKTKASKLYSVIKALTKQEPRGGESINIKNFLDETCQVVVATNDKGFPMITEVMSSN